MRKQLAKVPLETGNWIAWTVVTATLAFYAGWAGHVWAKAAYCYFW